MDVNVYTQSFTIEIIFDKDEWIDIEKDIPKNGSLLTTAMKKLYEFMRAKPEYTGK